MAYIPKGSYRILDTWYVGGLRGTGSTDYRVHEALVPEGRWVQLGTTPPARGGPLYHLSFFGFLAAEGMVEHDPTEQLKSPQVGKTLPRALTVSEVDELLEQIEGVKR